MATENDLKRLAKPELVDLATKAGVENAESMTVADLIPAILQQEAAAAAPSAPTEPEPPAESSAAVQSDVEHVKVRSANRDRTRQGGHRQVFRERHPDHPEGEVWIANDKTHKVALTRAVKKALADEVLELVQ